MHYINIIGLVKLEDRGEEQYYFYAHFNCELLPRCNIHATERADLKHAQIMVFLKLLSDKF